MAVVTVIQVGIAAGMAAGDYPIALKYVKLTETDISVYYLTEVVVSTLTVIDAGDGRIILEENLTTAPVAMRKKSSNRTPEDSSPKYASRSVQSIQNAKRLFDIVKFLRFYLEVSRKVTIFASE